jgi:tetratricopeptide (TPR) repeat protein
MRRYVLWQFAVTLWACAICDRTAYAQGAESKAAAAAAESTVSAATPATIGQREPATGSAPAAKTCAPAELAIVGNTERRARELLEEARCLFEAGDYRGSITRLEEAQKLTGSPRFLFNLGVAYHWLGDCERARDYYEEYLRRGPSEGGASQARAALRGYLYPKCGQSGIKQSLGAAPHHTDPRRWVMWSALGTGAVLAVATGVSGVLLNQTQSDFDALVRRSEGPGGEAWNTRQGAALVHEGKRLETLTLVFGVSALALLGTSTGLWLLEPREDISMSLGADGSPRLLLQGSF